VKVRALDLDGKSFTTQATGLLSVCIQHEMDHLKGKIFFIVPVAPQSRNPHPSKAEENLP